MLATSKLKMSGSEEKREQEHKQQNFFVRNYYRKLVSKKFHLVFVQRQRNAVKSVLHVLTCKVVVLPITETY